MRTPLEVIQNALSEELSDEDGDVLELTLLPGLDSAGVAKLEAELGTSLPPDIEELLRYARGFEFGPVDTVTFDAGFVFGMEDLLPRVIPLCGDGYGNFWVVEVQRDGAWGPVFYACHDPAVLVVQSKDVATFLEELFSLGRPDRTSALDEVHDDASMRVWRDEPWGKPPDDLRADEDEAVRSFVGELGPDDVVFDLREQLVGSGFAWGRREQTGDVRRCDDTLVFARVAPEPRPAPSKGFFRRLFGG